METITSAPAVLLGGGLTGYRESVLLAPAEAQKQGSDLGERFADIDLDEFSSSARTPPTGWPRSSAS
ncbi:hypothetical protein ACFQX6_64215 [Streptosporangium lutulentum]